MKRIAAATLVTLLGMGSAMAEYDSETQYGQFSGSGAFDPNTLPATAAGPMMGSGAVDGSGTFEGRYLDRDNQQY